MTHNENLEASRSRKLVDDDKFENHIKKARKMDRRSRSSVFDMQTEHREAKQVTK